MNENSAVLLQEEPPWNIQWNFSTSDYSPLYLELQLESVPADNPLLTVHSPSQQYTTESVMKEVNLYGVPYR